MTSESQYLAALTRIFASTNPEIIVGIGDDAAVVKSHPGASVLATDMAVEGNHFNRDWSSLFEIGAKVTAANLADIFAMAGTPRYILVAAAIPASFSIGEIEELARGIVDEAQKVGAVVIGGDLTASPLLTIAMSVFGEIDAPILRSGAKVGDLVAVSDLPGASMRGYKLLKQGIRDDRSALHRRPIVNYGKVEDISAHSLTDVSDGLIAELEGIAEASGVSIELDSKKFPTDEATLHGGEDHVFVGTFEKLPSGWIEIGRVAPGSSVLLDGKKITHQGWKHFGG